jgi:hypothetical protein
MWLRATIRLSRCPRLPLTSLQLRLAPRLRRPQAVFQRYLPLRRALRRRPRRRGRSDLCARSSRYRVPQIAAMNLREVRLVSDRVRSRRQDLVIGCAIAGPLRQSAGIAGRDESDPIAHYRVGELLLYGRCSAVGRDAMGSALPGSRVTPAPGVKKKRRDLPARPCIFVSS